MAWTKERRAEYLAWLLPHLRQHALCTRCEEPTGGKYALCAVCRIKGRLYMRRYYLLKGRKSRARKATLEG